MPLAPRCLWLRLAVVHAPVLSRMIAAGSRILAPPPSSSSLNLCQSLADLEPLLLLQAHHSKAVEIGESLSFLGLVHFLGQRSLLPLGADLGLFPRNSYYAGSRSAGKILNNERSQETVGCGSQLPGNRKLGVGGRSVD